MSYEGYVRSQVSEMEWRSLKAMGLNLDSRFIADIWPDYVNFEKRKQTEIPFLLDHLSEYADPSIFNVALGSGATTWGLMLEGIEGILSNEFDEEYARIAREEAEKLGLPLNVVSYDWRNLPNEYSESFDAVLCLGNSLTMLLRRADQIQALKNFWKALKPNGKLIIDERNYVQHFLGGRYKYSGDFVYCGKDKVSVQPVHISDSIIVMEYEHKEKQEKAHIVVYPFKNGEFRSLLEEAGFQDVTAFGDYKADFRPEDPEFITYVCRKIEN